MLNLKDTGKLVESMRLFNVSSACHSLQWKKFGTKRGKKLTACTASRLAALQFILSSHSWAGNHLEELLNECQDDKRQAMFDAGINFAEGRAGMDTMRITSNTKTIEQCANLGVLQKTGTTPLPERPSTEDLLCSTPPVRTTARLADRYLCACVA